MFEDLQIDNDLKMVDDVIRDYYGIAIKAKETKNEKEKEKEGNAE